METRHKLDEVQQQLQDSSSHAAQQGQQHSLAVARLTQDLQQEQQARSGLPSTFRVCMATPELFLLEWYQKTGIKGFA
jgi:hypothetical protein